jgi:hypothetical protein
MNDMPKKSSETLQPEGCKTCRRRPPTVAGTIVMPVQMQCSVKNRRPKIAGPTSDDSCQTTGDIPPRTVSLPCESFTGLDVPAGDVRC